MNRRSIESSYLFKDANCLPGEQYDIGVGEAAIFSVRSPDKTGFNEDAAAIISINRQSAVLLVADGVGGLPAGAQASSFLVDTIDAACLRSVTENIALREALLSGIEKANREIIELSNGSATTLAAVEIQENHIRSYHVGDSIILLTGQRGKLTMETVLHSPIGYAVEAGIISEVDAIHHKDRHLVSNVIGSKDMHISMSMPIEMKKFDTLLLATDGLIDNVEKETIINIIRKGPLDESSRALYELVINRMTSKEKPCKPDDVTCILFRCTI